MIARRLSVLAAVAALCLVSGVAGCTAPGYSGAVRSVSPRVLTQSELTGVLLRAEDLPTGYTLQPAAPAPPSEAGGQAGGSEPCSDVFDQLRGGDPALSRIASSNAQVEFGKGDYGPFLQQMLLSTGDRAAVQAAVEAFRGLPAACDEFTETDEQGSFTVKLAKADNLPSLGEESVALKLDANGRSPDLDVTLSGYMILFRKGSMVCILIHFGIPGVDVAETEKIARAAVARVG